MHPYWIKVFISSYTCQHTVIEQSFSPVFVKFIVISCSFPLLIPGLIVFCDSEGKMVVLTLAIGLAEQDDFANLPDLQEATADKETPPADKR